MDLFEEKKKLDNYIAQKVQVESLLKIQPDNKEFLQLKEELCELIVLTFNYIELKEKELEETSSSQKTKSSNSNNSNNINIQSSKYSSQQNEDDSKEEDEDDDEFENNINSILSSKQQNPKAENDGEEYNDDDDDEEEEENKMKFEKGMSCKAQWSEDGLWYDAIVEAVHVERGTYTVIFVGYGNSEEVTPSCIISINETPETAASLNNSSNSNNNKVISLAEYTPNNKIGREFPNPNNVTLKPIPIPESLRIKPDDPKEVVIAKKKKIHAIKSKNRFQQLETETKMKQSNWKQFVSTSGTSRKKGTFTVVNKKSMFSTPDSVTGKVGVIGSGQGMTAVREKKVEHKKTKITLPPTDDELSNLNIPPALE